MKSWHFLLPPPYKLTHATVCLWKIHLKDQKIFLAVTSQFGSWAFVLLFSFRDKQYIEGIILRKKALFFLAMSLSLAYNCLHEQSLLKQQVFKGKQVNLCFKGKHTEGIWHNYSAGICTETLEKISVTTFNKTQHSRECPPLSVVQGSKNMEENRKENRHKCRQPAKKWRFPLTHLTDVSHITLH